jgi:aminotransferase
MQPVDSPEEALNPLTEPSVAPSVSALVEKQLKGPSAIRQIMKLAERQNLLDMGLDPNDVISFAGGWVNHEAPAAMRQAYIDVASDPKAFHVAGGYTSTLGTDDCRAALAGFERELFGMPALSAANIAIGMGSTQLTHDLFRTILDPGDSVLLFDPTYANYEGQIAFAVPDVRVVSMPVLHQESWAYLPSTDPDGTIQRLEALWREVKPRAVVFCSPDNPTGQIFPQRMADAVMELAARDGAWVVVDFAYKCQCFGDAPEYFGWTPEEYPNLICVHSNSKWARGLGRRLGWIEAAAPVISGIERVQQASILCPDALHQMALARYLQQAIPDGSLRAYVDETRSAYERAAHATIEAIDEHLGLPRLVPEGGLYTVIDVGRDADVFVREVLKATGVLLVPGKGFGSTLARGVRISYGPLVTNLPRIDEGIGRVGRFMKA